MKYYPTIILQTIHIMFADDPPIICIGQGDTIQQFPFYSASCKAQVVPPFVVLRIITSLRPRCTNSSSIVCIGKANTKKVITYPNWLIEPSSVLHRLSLGLFQLTNNCSVICISKWDTSPIVCCTTVLLIPLRKTNLRYQQKEKQSV